MATPAMRNWTLVFRILTLLFSASCIAVLVTNTVKLLDGSKITFDKVAGYRYVLATAVIGGAYSLLQLPFAIYNSLKEKRLINGRFLHEFDFYVDKIMSFLLASGVGAGFAVSSELSSFAEDNVNDFLNKIYIAMALLLVAFIFMALLSVFSSIRRRTSLFFQ